MQIMISVTTVQPVYWSADIFDDLTVLAFIMAYK